MSNTAHGSRPGEANHFHVAGAVVAVGLIVLLAGIVNVRVGASLGRGGGG